MGVAFAEGLLGESREGLGARGDLGWGEVARASEGEGGAERGSAEAADHIGQRSRSCSCGEAFVERVPRLAELEAAPRFRADGAAAGEEPAGAPVVGADSRELAVRHATEDAVHSHHGIVRVREVCHPRRVPDSSSSPRLVWLDGEREAFAGKPGRVAGVAEEALLERLLEEIDKGQPLRTAEVARLGDEKLAELAEELGTATCNAGTLKMLLGRLGDGFLARAQVMVRASPRELFESAGPIESAELATSAANLLLERAIPDDEGLTPEHYAKTGAEAWLVRHAAVAFPRFASLADGVARCGAAFIAAHGEAPAEACAGRLEAVAALAPLVARDPGLGLIVARGEDERVAARVKDAPEARAFLERLRPAAPAAPLPAFFDVANLPRLKAREGEPLTDEAVRALGDQLRASTLLHPHASLAQARWSCDRDSLDAFATALLVAWCDAGEDPADIWALEASGILGGDAAAREVAARIRGWSRSEKFAYSGIRVHATVGCNVLAAQAQHGSELARLLLEELARTAVRFAVRKEARRLTGIVDVTTHEEAQIPTAGLDETGSATFDLGGEVYRVTFDETLAPSLVDASGARVASFPRLRKGIDEAAHAKAKARYAGMVKDAKTVARHQIAELERTMCEEELLEAEVFRERYVEHPLLRHLARRVVWTAGDTRFRVVEDGGSFCGRGRRAVHAAARRRRDRRASGDDERRRARDVEPALRRLRDLAAVPPARARDVPREPRRGARRAATSRACTTRRPSAGGSSSSSVAAGETKPHTAALERVLPGKAVARFTLSQPLGQGGDDEAITIYGATCSEALHLLPAIDYSELMRDLGVRARRALTHGRPTTEGDVQPVARGVPEQRDRRARRVRAQAIRAGRCRRAVRAQAASPRRRRSGGHRARRDQGDGGVRGPPRDRPRHDGAGRMALQPQLQPERLPLLRRRGPHRLLEAHRAEATR